MNGNNFQMNRAKNEPNRNIPSWQSRKMRRLIAERWQEVWQIVEAREKKNSGSNRITP